jgi:uncharacterized protein YcfJ
MNMKKLTLAVATVFSVAIPTAFAQDYRDNRNDNYQDRAWSRGRNDTARVVETRPVYEASSRREECWNQRAGHYEEVRTDEHGRKIGAGTVIGAVAGGVIGHQVGNGRGNDVATGLGAVIGGLVGNKIDRDNSENKQDDLDFSKCRVASQGNIQGYDVRYNYRGNDYYTRMDRNPGPTLIVGNDTRPDGRPMREVEWR